MNKQDEWKLKKMLLTSFEHTSYQINRYIFQILRYICNLKNQNSIIDHPLSIGFPCGTSCIYDLVKITHLRFAQIHLKPYRGYMPLLGNSSPFVRE